MGHHRHGGSIKVAIALSLAAFVDCVNQTVTLTLTLKHSPARCRQCSSGLQAVADVAAAIKAGFYTIGIGAGVETMSKNPMAWEGGVNPHIAESKNAQNCLVPMGARTAAQKG